MFVLKFDTMLMHFSDHFVAFVHKVLDFDEVLDARLVFDKKRGFWLEERSLKLLLGPVRSLVSL